ncbi:MAG: ParB N-terminal domain-containing protein [Candidatus Pacebacteria bacterium]|nr:ParB N-terminal domain-containing protein [Candidatus Paceibacterota bacterium]
MKKEQLIKIEEIKPYEKNAKKHPVKQINKIAESIKEFGFNQPLVLDKKKMIIVGHGRYEAAQILNLKEIPCIVVDLDEKQARAYRLADNKLNESDWDMDLVIEELKLLDKEKIEITGFDTDLIIEIKEDDFDAGKEYEKIKEPKAKVGDIYQLGRHRLMCGDSASREDVEKLMDGNLGRMIFTDPPYNVNYKSPGGLDYSSTKFGGTGGKIFNDNKSDKDCVDFYTDILFNLYHFTTDDVTIYWWFANKNNHLNRFAFENAGWHMSQIIIWLKNSMVFSRGQDYHRQYEPCVVGWKKKKTHYKNKKINNLKDVFNLDFDDYNEMLDVWFEKRDVTQNYVHPTQKPLRLPERALKKNSEKNDIVIDLFGGSGSTLMACQQLDRVCYSMELDPKYVDVIIKRYENYTGQKAKKVSQT